MTSIFDFVKSPISSEKSNDKSNASNFSPIFEEVKKMPEDKEPSRIRSILSAPVKGLLKGLKETEEISPIRMGPISPELGKRIIKEALPTQKKVPEKSLETAGRIGSYLIGPGKIASKAIRGGIATLGSVLSEQFGLPKGAQSAVEIGALLSPTTLKGAQKYISSLYSRAENVLPSNASVNSRNINQKLNSFIRNIKMGGTSPSKSAALTKAKEIKSKAKSGSVKVKELTEFKKTINEARSSLYLDQALDKSGKAAAKRNLDEISSIVDDTLYQYGTQNPQWNELYRAANEGHGAIANSKKVSNWIGKTIKQHPHASGTAIAGALIGHAFSPKSLVITGAGLAGIKSGELIARIAKSKVLREYYKNAIEAALNENQMGFLNNIKKLEKNLISEKEKED